MCLHSLGVVVTAVALGLGSGELARAQSPAPEVELVLDAGTTLRIGLHDRVRLKEVGQEISAALVEDVYAYDRVVLPAGTRALGRVASREGVSDRERAGAMLNGDFTPLKRSVLEFDKLVLADGREIAVKTEVRSATEQLVLTTREPPKRNLAEKAAADAAAQAKEALSQVKKPGKGARLKHGIVMALPYHPQYLEAGTVYTAVKTRFVAPALATLAFAGAMNSHLDYDTDGLGPETQYGTTGTRGLSGFFGWGLVGALLSQISHPVAVVFGVIGIVRTLLPAVLGRGRDIVFPEDTAMEVQLGSAPELSP